MKKKPSTTRRTIYYYTKATFRHWPFFLLDILSGVGYAYFLTFGNPLIIGKIVDIISVRKIASNEVFEVFGPYIILLVLCNVLGQVSSKLQDYSLWKLQIKVYYDLSTMCFDTLSNQSMTFHNNRFGGSLVSQTSKFASAYNQLMNTITYSIIPAVATVVFIIWILLPLVPLYTLAVVIFLAVYILIVYLMFRRLLKLNAKTAGAQNRLSGELSDSITNILAVKTSGREQYERDLFKKVNKEVYDTDSKRMRGSMWSGSVASAMIVVIMVVMTIFITGGQPWFGISAGTLIMMFTYTNTLTLRFNMLTSVMQNINRAFGDAHDMTAILDEPRLVSDVDHAKDLQVDGGQISFSDLSFRYIDGKVPTTVFEHFNLQIPAGQRVGLVGKSGSGKTTITRLLLRLADIQEGAIYVDGQDISKVTQTSLRRQIAYVPQEPLLFHRTIAENIAYGRPAATMEEIRQAAHDANALEFIEQLPDGFDTITGERGVKLSGGQRQRIAIARAILTDAPILVLDEATSALDSESEQLIQEALENLMRNRTSIVVAHRLSTVAKLDRIVVLKDGVIAEDGTHEKLLEENGEYAGLWKRQTT
ncbi:ATP-binding cassette, subfamily B [Eubacterium oxidoreducens]|uniref:ATP-binding cassette, subfamily B n=2 Tax=Eubacterium oxidoreducens TaxID=1732 RepID=A0A1G6A499_EUBOX|nr:ATP-binding cassette, subfamily B [Eubacterium oxidoreducens]